MNMNTEEHMTHDILDFQNDVIERSYEIPVLVDFWADWCAPCKMLAPVLERLAATDDRWLLAKLDTEAHPDVARQYGIRSIPNVKLFVDGAVVNEFAGALPESMVRQWLDKNLPSLSRKELEKAKALLAEGAGREAQSILERILANEPHNQSASVLLAQSILSTEPERARALVEHIEEDSPHYDVAQSVTLFAAVSTKDLAALPESGVRQMYIDAITAFRAGDYDAALRHFIDVLREDRYYDDDGSRKTCIAIFKLLGEEHEITRKHRRDFNSALY